MTPSSTQSIAFTGQIPITFDTVAYDNTGQMANITSHTITTIRPGRYAISASAYFDSLTDQEYSLETDIQQNGTANGLTFRTVLPIATGSLPTNASLVINGVSVCSGGDVITMSITQQNTGSAAITLFQGPFTYLTVTEIPQW